MPPRNAVGLGKHAEAHGWTVTVEEREGADPSKANPERRSTVFVLRCRKAGEPVLVGVWIDQRWLSGVASDAHHYNAAEFKARLGRTTT